MAKQNAIRLKIDFMSQRLLLDIEPSKVETMLIKLLSNVIKFTLPNGIASLSNNNTPAKTDVHLTITLSDTSPEIQAPDLEHSFDLLNQGDHHTTRRDGTGIGLAAVKDLTELQGEPVRVESHDAQGAILFVQIPLNLSYAGPTAEKMTGNALEDSTTGGYETQANDHHTKLFPPRELQRRIRDFITSRARLQQKLKREESLRRNDISDSIDHQFLENVHHTVEKCMCDERFGVEKLGQIIGMSRSQLHRKLKALTRQSPNQLIRSFRLTRAHYLLRQTAATSSEIAYRVGFSSTSYFSKCFHKEFGYTPTELVRSKN
jgi:AraC-like DNA-binding protein